MQMSSDPTVYIVDDDSSVREALGRLVKSLRVSVETYASAEEFLAAIDPSRPGCVVLDVRLGATNGLDLQETLVSRGASLPVIVITAYGTVATAVRAMRSGAIDVLEKPFKPREFLDRVQQALELDRKSRQARAERAAVRVAGFNLLTKREQEVLGLSVAGRTAKQIATALNLSVRTVEGHRANILAKLGGRSVSELITRLIQAGEEP
jgi:FixJ family two-component response regulator